MFLMITTRLALKRMSNKRTIDAFFAPAAKRPRNDIPGEENSVESRDEIVRLSVSRNEHVFNY